MPLGSKSKTIGVVTELTLITPIVPGQEAALTNLLQLVQQNPSAVIGQISTIHFARWVVVDSGKGDGTKNLLFTSNFDGTWQSYLSDFALKIPQGLDSIWGHCVGYPGCNPFDPFCQWVDQYQVPTTCFYPAYPNSTVNDIKRALLTKTAVDNFLQALP
jgi:hypothetical protein